MSLNPMQIYVSETGKKRPDNVREFADWLNDYEEWQDKRFMEMLTVIREMVELKDLSERIKARGSAVREAKENGDAVDLSDQVLTDWIADYTNRKEIAWQKMRELAGINNQNQ